MFYGADMVTVLESLVNPYKARFDFFSHTLHKQTVLILSNRIPVDYNNYNYVERVSTTKEDK